MNVRSPNAIRYASIGVVLFAVGSYQLSVSARPESQPGEIADRAPTHPTAQMAEQLGGPPISLPGGPPPVQIYNPDAPPDSSLESGAFVNFEAPATKSLALHNGLLYVCRTPNNSVAVLDPSTSPMTALDDIWVGLDPVTAVMQPGTNLLWVCNYSSDSIAVVDTLSRRVIDVIRVGDRPVNLVFSRIGRWAYAVCEGSPLVPDLSTGAPAGLVQEGALVAIDGATRQIVRSRWLDCHTPRGLAYDSVNQRVIVSALHSGNNTTTVGITVFHHLQNVPPTNPGSNFDFRESWPVLVVPLLMPSLADLWANPALTPWPDPTINALAGAELVERIVSDAGHAADSVSFPWQEMVDRLSDANGNPEPAMVAEYKSTFESVWQSVHGAPITLVNASAVLLKTIRDAKDTVDHDIIVVDAVNPAAANGLTVQQRIGNVGATLTGLAYDEVRGTLLVSNLEPNNLTRLETNLRGNLVDHQVVKLTAVGSAVPVVQKFDLHAGLAGFDDVSGPNPAAQAISAANPTDIVFRADGQRAFVAALGSGRVATIDPSDGRVMGLRDVGGVHSSPRCLLMDSATDVLYVFDRTNMTVTKLDATNDAMPVLAEACLANPEPIGTRTGRKFLFSTRFSNNYSSSCAVCHIDGHMDHRAWDLGQPDKTAMLPKPHIPAAIGSPCTPSAGGYNHPIKGPMVTLSLRGLKGRNPFHWRGDKPQFQDFNEAFVGLLGAQNQLSDADMDRYTEFVNTMAYQPTFYRNVSNQFKEPGAVMGRSLYLDSCQVCHRVEDDGAFRADCVSSDIALNFLGPSLFAQVEEIPQLRQIVDKFQTDKYGGVGLLHDGREEREANNHPIETFLQEFFGGLVPLSGEMISFLSAFQTNVMPCVGEQFLWTSTADTADNALLNELIRQHDLSPSRCDIVLSGKVSGVKRGYVLTSGGDAPMFRSDLDESLTLEQISALVDSGAALNVAAVPPGSGRRIGIDWDRDCISNGVDPRPLIPAGDADGDYKAGLSDLAVIITHWGRMSGAKLEDGDLNGDCAVTLADISEVITNWGWECVYP